MIVKEVCGLAKVLGVVFTSVVAPVLVHIAVHDLQHESDESSRTKPVSAKGKEDPAVRQIRGPIEAAPSISPPAQITQVIVEGVGPTPTESLQKALRAALENAVAAEPGGWAVVKSPVLLERLMRESGLYRCWKQLSITKEWRLRGSLYHLQVAVELDRTVLVAQLQNALQHCATGPP
jgi:hypothetical protein